MKALLGLEAPPLASATLNAHLPAAQSSLRKQSLFTVSRVLRVCVGGGGGGWGGGGRGEGGRGGGGCCS